MTQSSVQDRPLSDVLIRKVDDISQFEGLARIGDRLARSMRQTIASLGCNDIVVTAGEIQLTTFGAFRIDQKSPDAFCLFQMDPMKSGMLMELPVELIAQLVDIFFGGAGEKGSARKEFSSAELRLIQRLGEQFAPQIAASWADIAAVNVSFTGFSVDLADAGFARDHDLIIKQSLVLRSGQIAGLTVNCIYHSAALRQFGALAKDAQPNIASANDPLWRDLLTEAVMQVRLPMRSIFARPELSLSQLLNLAVGDVIPVCLPQFLPIAVAGRQFAHGTVGESGGRLAIRIEKIEEGFNDHE